MSVFQCKLSALPHEGRRARLSCVTCFQLPVGPAHTSGGALNDSRTAAEVLPSRESETPTVNWFWPMCSAPAQSGVTAPESRLTEAAPLLPSTISPNTMDFESDDQLIELAVAFMLGVTSRASPPRDELAGNV